MPTWPDTAMANKDSMCSLLLERVQVSQEDSPPLQLHLNQDAAFPEPRNDCDNNTEFGAWTRKKSI